MGQTVYGDLLFLINFSMDYLCFYITARLLHRDFPRIRALIASAVGGVYSVAILFAGLVPPLELVVTIAVGLIMCVIVFPRRKVGFLRTCLCSLTYVGVSAALAGIMTAIFNMLNSLGLPLGSLEENGDGMPVWLFAVLAVVSGAATLAGGRFFRKKQSERTADVEITLGKRSVKLAAMFDSGNLLRDPISGRPIVVIDVDETVGMLPAELILAVRRNDTANLTDLPPDTARRLRIVPSHTAHGSGVLCAFLPDRITVALPGESPHEVNALIAPAKLNGSASGFKALLPPELAV